MRKNILTLIGLWAALTAFSQTAPTQPTAPAQPAAPAKADPVTLNTNSLSLEGPLITLLGNLSTATNLAITAYGIYDTAPKPGADSAGFGLTALYNITPWAATGVGMEFMNGDVWMPSGQVQLQAPFTIGGKVTLIPFGFTGVATPVSGRAADNGTAVGIFGAGLAARIYTSSGGAHLSIFTAISKWTGFDGEKIYGGLVYRF